MSGGAVVVPEMVRRRAAALGDRGERWLAGLPDLVAGVEREWSVRLGEPLAGGSASYVALARTADGRDAVVKLAVPEPGFDGQVRTLAAARGVGYARLLAADPERHALLLERLGTSLAGAGLPPERVIDVLGITLRQAWRVPRPAQSAVVPGEDRASQLARLVGRLWKELGHPCSERVVDVALRFAARRAAAFDPDRCVVVHGDAHAGNALRVTPARPGAESGYAFVDPDGFLAEPAYDLGVVLRDWCAELLAAADPVALARRYCRRLADRSGVDATAVWEWGLLERVSSGLYVLALGGEATAGRFLRTAELLSTDCR